MTMFPTLGVGCMFDGSGAQNTMPSGLNRREASKIGERREEEEIID